MTMKYCNGCKKETEYTEFRKNGEKADHEHCSVCGIYAWRNEELEGYNFNGAPAAQEIVRQQESIEDIKMKTQKVEAVVIDIRDSVFQGKSDGLLYITKDIFGADTTYGFFLNTHDFSCTIREDQAVWDLEQAFKRAGFFTDNEKEGLTNVIKAVTANWFDIY